MPLGLVDREKAYKSIPTPRMGLVEQYYQQPPRYPLFAQAMQAVPGLAENFREVMGRVPLMGRVADMMLAPVDPLAMATFGGRITQGLTKPGQMRSLADAGYTDLTKPQTNLSIRDKFGMNLTPEGKSFMRYIEQNRNKISIHPNAKTGLSLDFSTCCPAREGGKGACAYCYVEHVRTQEDLGMGLVTSPKKKVDNPYRGEIARMPSDVVEELNADGGLRMNSFGDYRPNKDYDNVKNALDDASVKGLMIKGITKVKELIDTFGNHPNFRANISTDLLPREMSNAPSIEEALQWKKGKPNVKIRAVALNEQQAFQLAADPRVDVITLYHGPTGDKLFDIVKAQNPILVERIGEDALRKELATWQNMPPNSKIARDVQEKAKGRVCCTGGKCSKDPTKCGFGVGSLLSGVVIPEWFGKEDEWESTTPVQ